MARNITVTFSDGSSHTYQNAPDDVTPDAVQTRAEKEFGKTVSHLDGGKPAAAAASPAQPYQRQPSLGEKIKSVAYPVAEAVGAGLGGLIGTGAAPVAGTVAGSALGYAGVKGLENIIDQYTGGAAPETLGQAAARTASDIATGATYELGGQVLGAIPAVSARTGINLYQYLSPKDKVYLAAAEGQGQELVNALRAGGSNMLVPGSRPTAAQAAASVQAPKFAALGQESANILPTQYFSRAEAQKAAQLAAIRGIGQTQADLDAAIAAREASARNTYGISDKALLPGRERVFEPQVIGVSKAAPRVTPEGLPITEEVSGQIRPSVLMGDTSVAGGRITAEGQPIMEEIGRDSLTNAPIFRQSQSVPFSRSSGAANVQTGRDILTNAPITQPSMSIGGQPITTLVAKGYKNDPELQKLVDRPAVATAINLAEKIAQNKGQSIFDANGKLTGAGAQMIKVALDDAITTSPMTAIGKGEKNAILSAKTEFVNWVEKNIPTYKAAREIFANQSKPINQMQVGQYLENKLIPALGADTANLRAAGFAGAVETAPATIKRATGEDRFTQLSQILTPEQLKTVTAVRDDLARAAQAERQAAAAGGQGKALIKAGTEELSAIRAPNLLSRVTAVANNIMQRLQGKIDKKLAIELATEMLNPSSAATGIENALRRQQMGEISPLNNLRFGALGRGAMYSAPTVNNFLSQPSP